MTTKSNSMNCNKNCKTCNGYRNISGRKYFATFSIFKKFSMTEDSNFKNSLNVFWTQPGWQIIPIIASMFSEPTRIANNPYCLPLDWPSLYYKIIPCSDLILNKKNSAFFSIFSVFKNFLKISAPDFLDFFWIFFQFSTKIPIFFAGKIFCGVLLIIWLEIFLPKILMNFSRK